MQPTDYKKPQSSDTLIESETKKNFWILRIHDLLNLMQKLEIDGKKSTPNQKKMTMSKFELSEFLHDSLSSEIPMNLFDVVFDPLVDKNTSLIEVNKCFISIRRLIFGTRKKKILRKRKKPSDKLTKPQKMCSIFIPVKQGVNKKVLVDVDTVSTEVFDWFLFSRTQTSVQLSNMVNRSDNNAIRNAIDNDLTLANSEDAFYKTPLLIAAAKGDAQTVDYLLKDKQVDVNKKDNFKWNALHHAVFGGHVGIAKELIRQGIDLNGESLAGMTPLMLAFKADDEHMVYLLVKHDAKLITSPNRYKQRLADLFEFVKGSLLEDLLRTVHGQMISVSFDNKQTHVSSTMFCSGLKRDSLHDFPGYKNPFQNNIQRLLELKL